MHIPGGASTQGSSTFGMIDIHHHLLFGLDDGPRDLETSLQMAEIAIEDGITHVVCTPHANSEYIFSPEENAARLAQLQEKLGDRLTLGLGCDFHLSFDNIESAREQPERYSINRGRYLLVEFPDFGIPQNISNSFHEMLVAGVVPILTHPERNLTLMQKPEKLDEWLEMGCLVQVTAGSLLGRFGKGPQRVAQQLLASQRVHVIATDAHNTTSRPPVMSDAYNFIAGKQGEQEAERLCVENPRRIFYSEPLAEKPTSPAAQEEEETAPRRGLFSFFRRK
ncbi:MAG: tyrosine-protein phosphatase [Acidobacteriaceae bacterium]